MKQPFVRSWTAIERRAMRRMTLSATSRHPDIGHREAICVGASYSYDMIIRNSCVVGEQ